NDYFINPMAAWKGNSYTRRNRLKQAVNENQTKLFGEDLPELLK
ncbi:unnamed protein product, partial [marine sediment metagenome]